MNKGKLIIFKSLKILVASSFLTAISIVLGKYLAIPLGTVMRLSFENLPILLAGIIFGPFVGATVGVVADIIGCALMGWTPIPMVTVGAGVIGFLAGISRRILRDIHLNPTLKICIPVAVAHIVGSVIIKTVGLADTYAMPFMLLVLMRAVNYIIVGALEILLIRYLLRSKAVNAAIRSIKGGA